MPKRKSRFEEIPSTQNLFGIRDPNLGLWHDGQSRRVKSYLQRLANRHEQQNMGSHNIILDLVRRLGLNSEEDRYWFAEYSGRLHYIIGAARNLIIRARNRARKATYMTLRLALPRDVSGVIMGFNNSATNFSAPLLQLPFGSASLGAYPQNF